MINMLVLQHIHADFKLASLLRSILTLIKVSTCVKTVKTTKGLVM